MTTQVQPINNAGTVGDAVTLGLPSDAFGLKVLNGILYVILALRGFQLISPGLSARAPRFLSVGQSRWPHHASLRASSAA